MRGETLGHGNRREQHDPRTRFAGAGLECGRGGLHGREGAERIDAEVGLYIDPSQPPDQPQVDGANRVDQTRERGTDRLADSGEEIGVADREGRIAEFVGRLHQSVSVPSREMQGVAARPKGPSSRQADAARATVDQNLSHARASCYPTWPGQSKAGAVPGQAAGSLAPRAQGRRRQA